MELIPNLPNDVARECLLRTSYKQFPIMASVCKGWNFEVSLSKFLQQRKAFGHSQELLVLSQARLDPDNKEPGSGKSFISPEYRVVVLESGSGLWTELPPIPGLSRGLPLFCSLVSVGSDLVVLGGLDPVTWQASDSVYVFSFLTSKWRVGATMPGVRRSFFGCASDFDRTVLVAGGHDEEKYALTSALMYDVAEDKWTFLPNMSRERDECKVIFHGGRFHIIGGYATEEQGQFSQTAESFDVSTWQWGPLADEFFAVEETVSSPLCANGEDGELYACWRGEVMVSRNDTWQKVAQVPADVYNVAYLAVRSGKLIVIGNGKGLASYGQATTVGYLCDLSSFRWVKLETEVGHVQGGCFLEV